MQTSNETRSLRTGDDRCRACGTMLRAREYFDTRGRGYCGPDCWEAATEGRTKVFEAAEVVCA